MMMTATIKYRMLATVCKLTEQYDYLLAYIFSINAVQEMFLKFITNSMRYPILDEE